MSLLLPEPRRLGRDKPSQGYRDDRTFLIACDDRYAPKQYFDFFRIRRIRIVVAAAEDDRSAPRHALERLREEKAKLDWREDDESWLLLDTDHHIQPNHRSNFIQVIHEAESERIQVALSRPCFEFWLLLHHVDEEYARRLDDCSDIARHIRSSAGQYNKTNLRREDFPVGSPEAATMRAERLDSTVAGGDIPEAPTSRVHRLIRAITAKGLPSDLPLELRNLSPLP